MEEAIGVLFPDVDEQSVAQDVARDDEEERHHRAAVEEEADQRLSPPVVAEDVERVRDEDTHPGVAAQCVEVRRRPDLAGWNASASREAWECCDQMWFQAW